VSINLFHIYPFIILVMIFFLRKKPVRVVDEHVYILGHGGGYYHDSCCPKCKELKKNG